MLAKKKKVNNVKLGFQWIAHWNHDLAALASPGARFTKRLQV